MKKLSSKQFDKLQERLEFKMRMPSKTADVVDIIPSLAAYAINKSDASKKIPVTYENNEEAGSLKRTIVANTYNWLDSHDDVHLEGVFTRSIDHKGAENFPHLHDHIFQLDAKIGETISLQELAISWRQLGVKKSGSTIALVAVSEILKDYNEKIYGLYLKDKVDQHSVRMRYKKINLAVNDADEWPEEFKVWEEVYPLLGNKKKADEQGFFFAVREAELFEYSGVLAGSNELTQTLKDQKLNPLENTSEEESSKDTLRIEVSKALDSYIFKL